MCINIPYFSKISQTAFDILQFFDFQDGGCLPSWIFKRLNIIIG